MAEPNQQKGPEKPAVPSIFDDEDIVVEDLRGKKDGIVRAAAGDVDALAGAAEGIQDSAKKAKVDVAIDEKAKLAAEHAAARARLAELHSKLDAILQTADADMTGEQLRQVDAHINDARIELDDLREHTQKEDVDAINARIHARNKKADAFVASEAEKRAQAAAAKLAADAATHAKAQQRVAERMALAPEQQRELDDLMDAADEAWGRILQAEQARDIDPSLKISGDEYIHARAVITRAYEAAKKLGSKSDMAEIEVLLEAINKGAENNKGNAELETDLRNQLALLRKQLVETEVAKGVSAAGVEIVREQYEAAQAELVAAGLLNLIDERVQLTHERMRQIEPLFGDGVGRSLLKVWNTLGWMNAYDVARWLSGADKNLQGQTDKKNETWRQTGKRWASNVGAAVLRMGSARTVGAMLITGTAATVVTGGGFAAATALGAFGAAALGVGRHDSVRANFRQTETQKNIDTRDLDSESMEELEQMLADMEVRIMYNGIDINNEDDPAVKELREQYTKILKAIEARQLAPEAAEAQAKKLQEVLAVSHAATDKKLAQFREADKQNAWRAIKSGAIWGAVGFGLGAGFRMWSSGFFGNEPSGSAAATESAAAPRLLPPEPVAQPAVAAPEVPVGTTNEVYPWEDTQNMSMAQNPAPEFGAPEQTFTSVNQSVVAAPEAPAGVIDPTAPGAPDSSTLTDEQVLRAVKFDSLPENGAVTDAQVQEAIQYGDSMPTTGKEALAELARDGWPARVELGDTTSDVFMVGKGEGFTHAYLDYLKKSAEALGYDKTSGVSVDKWAKKLLVSQLKEGKLSINGVEYNPWDPSANQQLWVMEPDRYGFSFTTNADGTVSAIPHDMDAGGAPITESGALDKAFDQHTIKAPSASPEPVAPAAPEPVAQPETSGPQQFATEAQAGEGPLAIPYDGLSGAPSGEGALAIPYDGYQPVAPFEPQANYGAGVGARPDAGVAPAPVDGKFGWKGFLENFGMDSQKQYFSAVTEKVIEVGDSINADSVIDPSAAEQMLESLRESKALVIGDPLDNMQVVFNGQGDVVREFVGFDRVSDDEVGTILYSQWETLKGMTPEIQQVVEADAAKLFMLREAHEQLVEAGLVDSKYDRAITKAAERLVREAAKYGPVLAADIRPTDAVY